jgi:hypothetical protein
MPSRPRTLITAVGCLLAVAALIAIRPVPDRAPAPTVSATPSEHAVPAWHSAFAEADSRPSIGQPWQASTDKRQGGGSEARLLHHEDSTGSGFLRVEGSVMPGAAYPWSGAIWMLGETPMQPVDARTRGEIVLRVRGDGRRLMLMLLSGEPGGLPQMRWLDTTGDWQTERLTLAGFPGAELGRLRAVVLAASLPHGDFHFDLASLSIQ